MFTLVRNSVDLTVCFSGMRKQFFLSIFWIYDFYGAGGQRERNTKLVWPSGLFHLCNILIGNIRWMCIHVFFSPSFKIGWKPNYLTSERNDASVYSIVNCVLTWNVVLYGVHYSALVEVSYKMFTEIGLTSGAQPTFDLVSRLLHHCMYSICVLL